jgi:hypothetical protein
MRYQDIVLGVLCALGIVSVTLSIIILRRGKLYHRISPDARPRRWVLIALLVLLTIFLVWFPVWVTWPHALISRLLTGLFGFTFFAVLMTIEWLSGIVDRYIERKGWALR